MTEVPELQVEELRTALEQGVPLAVLDVRPAAERAEWWIPGSQHVDAYADLWRGEFGGLRQAVEHWSREVPVVTVCARGRTSALAAEALRRSGFKVHSLAGGMRAWSEAWNMAAVPLPAEAPTVIQVRRVGKGCLSYLIGSADEAAVIDPAVDAAVYQRLAAGRGWRIVAVFDTHVHADHVSRAYALAQRVGVPVFLPAQNRVQLCFVPVEDGQEFAVGRTTVRAVRTPGHTYESTCFAISESALATGDTLFLEGVGRPDLKAAGNESAERARLLYRSLRDRIFTGFDAVVILPGHASRPLPFDGVAHAAPLAEVRAGVSLAELDEDTFVASVLARIPPTPPNYDRIVRINEGREALPEDLTELEAGANRCAVSTQSTASR